MRNTVVILVVTFLIIIFGLISLLISTSNWLIKTKKELATTLDTLHSANLALIDKKNELEAAQAAAAINKAALISLHDDFDAFKRTAFSHNELTECWNTAVDYGYTNAIIDAFFQQSYVTVTQKDGKLIVWKQQYSYPDPTPTDSIPFTPPQAKKHK